MTKLIIREIDAERRTLTARLRALDKARALLEPEEEVPAIKRIVTKGKKRRKPTRRASKPSTADRGLAKTIVTALGQMVPKPGYVGLTAVQIVTLLEGRGFLFTSKFPSRSVSGLLTILNRKGIVERTPKGHPRIYHYRSAANSAAVPDVSPVRIGAAEGLASAEV
jgi:hypothetical protein